MDKPKPQEIMPRLAPACVAEAVAMVGVKAWLWVPMEEAAPLCAVVALSSSPCNRVQILALADKEMICQDVVARLDTIETPPETLKAIGEINLPKAKLNKINKVPWATSRVNKVGFNQVIATADR